MSLIGKTISSIVISFVRKSRTTPSSFMVLHPRMRSYTGLVIFFLSYSTMSGVTRYSVLFEYSKNFKLTLLLPFVRKFPFEVCQEFGTSYSSREMHVSSFSWNMRSPSDHFSSRFLMTVLLGRLLAECSNLCWAWFSVVFWYLALATTAASLPSYLLLKEELTLLRKTPGSGEVHTIEKGTLHFRVRQFGSYLTLWFFALFCNKTFLILSVQGIIINPIIQNRIVHYITMIF